MRNILIDKTNHINVLSDVLDDESLEVPISEQDLYQGILFIDHLLDENEPTTDSQSLNWASAKVLIGHIKEQREKRWKNI